MKRILQNISKNPATEYINDFTADFNKAGRALIYAVLVFILICAIALIIGVATGQVKPF